MKKISVLAFAMLTLALVSVTASQHRPAAPPKVSARGPAKPLPDEWALLRDLRRELKGRLFLGQVRKQIPKVNVLKLKSEYGIRLDDRFRNMTIEELKEMLRQANEQAAGAPILAYEYAFSVTKDICAEESVPAEGSALSCVTDGGVLKASKSVAAIVFDDVIEQDTTAGQWTLVTHPLTGVDTSYAELCSGEPFVDQPSTKVKGTGFLVADDVIATAGHVIDRDDFLNVVCFVFDYITESGGAARTKFDDTQVYKGKEIVARRLGDADWALIRLERPVAGRPVLKCRTEGKVTTGMPVYMLGYPEGMPQKYSGPAEVGWNDACCYFLSKLDGRPGNSGSPVINAVTGLVEGIFVHDEPAYELVCDCVRTASSTDAEGSPGADVVRTTEFTGFLQNPQSVLVECRALERDAACITVAGEGEPRCFTANTSQLVPWSDLGLYLTVNMECDIRYDPEPGSVWEIVEPGDGYLKMQKVCFP